MLPVAPSSPDYVPGPEEPHAPPAPQDEDEHEPMFIQPHHLDFVPEPIYPDYIPLEDEHVLSAEEQPLPLVVSPTPESPESVIPSPSTNTATTGARITVRLQATISFFMRGRDAETRRQGIGEVGYGIRDTWVDPTETVLEMAPMTVGEVNTRVTELVELHEHDTQDLYALLKDAQDSRTRISQRVAMDSQRVYLLIEERIAHQETIQIVEDEAYAAREAMAHSIGLSQAVHYEVQTHQEQMQQTEMPKLRETDRRRQTQMVETLRVMGDMRREMGDMQAELLALSEQSRRAGQPGRDARVPNHHDAPRDSDSHI
nr:hypothetical protein [Tanacetum cinerariifolium]